MQKRAKYTPSSKIKVHSLVLKWKSNRRETNVKQKSKRYNNKIMLKSKQATTTTTKNQREKELYSTDLQQ